MTDVINSIHDIVNYIMDPIIGKSWLQSLINWINGLIRSILSLWNENTAYIPIDYDVISDIICLVLFIVIIVFIVSIFKLVISAFGTIQDTLNPAWRSEWRRKGRK